LHFQVTLKTEGFVKERRISLIKIGGRQVRVICSDKAQELYQKDTEIFKEDLAVIQAMAINQQIWRIFCQVQDNIQ